MVNFPGEMGWSMETWEITTLLVHDPLYGPGQFLTIPLSSKATGSNIIRPAGRRKDRYLIRIRRIYEPLYLYSLAIQPVTRGWPPAPPPILNLTYAGVSLNEPKIQPCRLPPGPAFPQFLTRRQRSNIDWGFRAIRARFIHSRCGVHL